MSVAERQLQEVIVTATRRQESNQRVPIGRAAFSADDAQKVGVTDGQSLAALVPGLLFNRQANTSWRISATAVASRAGDAHEIGIVESGAFMVQEGCADRDRSAAIPLYHGAREPSGASCVS